METGENPVKFAMSRAVLDVSVEIVGARMSLDIAGNEEFHLAVTTGRYLLTGCRCRDKTRQNDFDIREDRTPGFSCWFLGLKVYVL